MLTTGARVRNTYIIYLLLENSPKKFGLILHNNIEGHLLIFKVQTVKDENARYQLVGEVTAHQGDDI